MTDAPPISSPHRHSGASVQHTMLRVAAALLPGLAAYVWFFGSGVLLHCLLALGTALCAEAILLRLRGRSPLPQLLDGSAAVTALLLALCIPPLAPWWITVTATLFAVALAKHAFGGLGHNLFNPAMSGYVFVLLCFPARMNGWPAAPGVADSPSTAAYLAAIFGPGGGVDALSGATALARMQSQLGSMQMVSEIGMEPMFGTLAGAGWEWIAAGWLAGGVMLLALGVIRWQIPAGMLGALFLLGALFHVYDGDVYPSPLFQLFAGAAMLGAFFIATDPVTAPATPRGRLLFGALIGTLVFCIRTWGAYPDGVAFAVLLGNAAAPLIDRCTRPRVLGEHVDG